MSERHKDTYDRLSNALDELDLAPFGSIDTTADADTVRELGITLLGNLATKLLNYRLRPENDRGLEGYRPVDRYKDAVKDTKAASAVLDTLAPFQVLYGEYDPKSLSDYALSKPEHKVHQALTWNDWLNSEAKTIVEAARQHR